LEVEPAGSETELMGRGVEEGCSGIAGQLSATTEAFVSSEG